MKLFGLFNKDKAIPFPQFIDAVRLSVRRAYPGAKIENSENGLMLTIPEQRPFACNLRSLYNAYSKTPSQRDTLISEWMDTLSVHITDEPDKITWQEARLTLRPILKDAEYIASARASMLRHKDPDSLPNAPFVGELSVIVMREVSRTLTGVTQKALDAWGVPFETVLAEALNNMNLMSFPPVTNELRAGGATRKNAADQETVGLVFEGDHMTATWLILERFRDNLTQRLQGDYVVFAPSRNRLIAVRADEPGLIASVQQSNRNYRSLPYSLTAQCIHISASQTGGVPTLFQQGGGNSRDSLDPNSLFAPGRTQQTLPNLNDQAAQAGGQQAAPAGAAGYSRPQPVDLSAWGGLSESTADPKPASSASGKLGRR